MAEILPLPEPGLMVPRTAESAVVYPYLRSLDTAVRDINESVTSLVTDVDSLGDYVSSTVAIGSAVALTSGIVANLTSISLSAGDWDVSANFVFSTASGTSVTQFIAGFNTTSATLPTFGSPDRIDYAGPAAVNFFLPMVLGPSRFNVGGTTTVYAVAAAAFTVSTMSVCGRLSARRAATT